MLSHLPAFLLNTTIQGLPAIIALVAWSEGGHRIHRQFGARMLWELAAVVAVGIGFLLHVTLRLVPDESAHVGLVIVTALSSVPLVTMVTHRVPIVSSRLRLTLATGVSLVGLQLGALIGVGLYILQIF